MTAGHGGRLVVHFTNRENAPFLFSTRIGTPPPTTAGQIVLGIVFHPAVTWGVGAILMIWLIWSLTAIHRRLEERAVDVKPTPPNPPNPNELTLVGRTSDQRAVLRFGDRVVEFDADAYEFYQGGTMRRDKRPLARSQSGSKRCSAKQLLRRIISGGRATEEDVYIERGSRTKFWTRSDADNNRPKPETNADLLNWCTKGEHERSLRAAIADMKPLLQDASALLSGMRPEIKPKAGGVADLATEVPLIAQCAAIDEWGSKLRYFYQKHNRGTFEIGKRVGASMVVR